MPPHIMIQKIELALSSLVSVYSYCLHYFQITFLLSPRYP